MNCKKNGKQKVEQSMNKTFESMECTTKRVGDTIIAVFDKISKQ